MSKKELAINKLYEKPSEKKSLQFANFQFQSDSFSGRRVQGIIHICQFVCSAVIHQGIQDRNSGLLVSRLCTNRCTADSCQLRPSCIPMGIHIIHLSIFWEVHTLCNLWGHCLSRRSNWNDNCTCILAVTQNQLPLKEQCRVDMFLRQFHFQAQDKTILRFLAFEPYNFWDLHLQICHTK